jgi:hypothetical protein
MTRWPGRWWCAGDRFETMVSCPSCAQWIPLASPGVPETLTCGACGRQVTAVEWPAASHDAERGRLPGAMVAGEAACFACPDRAATGVCEGCGSYTCPACEAEWFGASLCLNCLHARRELAGETGFRSRTLVYDNIALMLLVLPIICVPFYGLMLSILASPIILFLVIRHRHSPRGLPPRGPLRLVLAGGLALLLMISAVGGMGLAVYAVVRGSQAIDEAEARLEELGDGSGQGMLDEGEAAEVDEAVQATSQEEDP